MAGSGGICGGLPEADHSGLCAGLAWARLDEFADVLRLVVPSAKVLDYARLLHRDRHVSFWDAMIIGACMDCGAQTLYSEDLPGREVGAGLEIVDPFR